MKTFKEYQPDQALLFPVDLSEWLPKDHPAHFVNDFGWTSGPFGHLRKLR